MGDEDTTQLRQVQTRAPAPAGEARLVVLSGESPGRSYDVGDGLTIGRAAELEVRVDDTSVSRVHARITRRPGGKYLLEDLQSRNGTLLNDERVTTRVLAFGDRIQIGGQAQLLFTHHHPLEEQVRRKQRLEAIGELSAGVAHDLNNLLGAVLASVDYLRALPPDRPLGGDDVRECVADIVAATVRGSELTQRLLRFARRGRSTDEPVEIARLCREVGQLARRTFSRKITVTVTIDGSDDDLVVVGNYSQLYHALLNLCINARDAMPDRGALTIDARREGDQQILLTVRDTGIGMDAATVERMFEPFFTTKGAEGGSGLGLSSAQAAIKSHGGRLEVKSAPGRGTEIRIALPTKVPIGRDAPSHDTPRFGLSDTAPGEARPTGLIMLVDDDQVLRRSIGRVLRQAGHDIVFAADGEDAVRAFRAAKRRPDVIVLDLDMPRLSGDEAFAELRRIDPQLRVVFLTGLATDEQRTTLLSQGALECLQKPCDAVTLVRTITNALRSAPA